MGISLWIVPPEPEASILQELIDNPPPLHGREASHYPSFSPHITLGSFPSSTSLEELKASMKPLPTPLSIKFDSVCVGDHYFRSVFIAIELSEALIKLHEDVHSILKLHVNVLRYPHLSLYYIEDSKLEEKQTILDALWETDRVRSLPDGHVSIVYRSKGNEESSEPPRLVTGFEAREVWLVLCDGPVETWKILDKVVLCP